jgi:hypothetical protein
MIEILETKQIKVNKLVPNNGQIEGLPKNPRFIKDDRYKKLVKSLEDNPEMLGARELIVYPYDNNFFIIAGNMRYRACLEIGLKEIPCKVLPVSYTVDQLKAITIKDNISYGNDDFDALANEWDVADLADWGMEFNNFNSDIDINELSEEFTLPQGDKAPFQQMTFTLADEQAEQIKNAIDDIKHTEEYKYIETMGNENSNGNALYLIIMQWAEQKK